MPESRLLVAQTNITTAFVAENNQPERMVFCCFDAYAADLHRRAIAALAG